MLREEDKGSPASVSHYLTVKIRLNWLVRQKGICACPFMLYIISPKAEGY